MNPIELFTLANLRERYRAGATPLDIVEEVFRRMDAWGDDHIWTTRVAREVVRAQARALGERLDEREHLPLFGVPFGVKDNLDVDGMHTSCGCPSFARHPDRSATAIERAVAAGAILIGKQALDQFATGLNGTRTLGGHPKNVFSDRIIPGGSSCGSGVAVAAGLVAFSLGSDTGGSGRVPAAMNNIVGVRPTVGLVSGRGMVYNNPSFDCIPVFAPTVEDAFEVLRAIAGFDDEDPWSRPDTEEILGARAFPDRFVFGIPRELEFYGDAASRQLFDAAVERMRSIGGTPVAIDFSPFYEAGQLIFGSGLVAERAASYGHALTDCAPDLVPAVASILEAGVRYSAVDAFRATYRIQALRGRFLQAMAGVDVLLTPTVPRPYTVEEMLREPLARNAEVGFYTYGVGPMGLCALSIPSAMREDGLPFGVSLVARGGQDGQLGALALRLQAATRIPPGIQARRDAPVASSL